MPASANCVPRPAFPAAAALLAASCALSPPARAQVIDQYLNTDIPGYGETPGVTVASRAHPEYDPQGVRVGLLTLRPDVSEGIGYDDNVTGTANPRGSLLFNTTGRLLADYALPGTPVTAALSVDDWEYPERGAQSYTNWSAAIGATHEFGQDRLTLGATHLTLNQTPRDLDVPRLAGSVSYRVDDVRAAYRASFGRIAITPGIEAAWFDFDSGAYLGPAGPATYDQSYRNRFVVTPSLQAEYEFAPRRRALVIVRDSIARFNAPNRAASGTVSFPAITPGVLLPRQDFNDVSILAGLAYEVTGALTVRLLAGFEHRDFSARQLRSIDAPIAEGSVTWTPTGLTTVTATIARAVQNSSSDETSGYTATVLRLGVDHELYRNVVLTGRVEFDQNDYAGNGGSQSFVTAGAGVAWHLNRNLKLAAEYSFSNRSSANGGSPVVTPIGVLAAADYTENVVALRVTFSL